MVRWVLVPFVAMLAILLAPGGRAGAAVLSAPAMYADAQAQERAVRRVLDTHRPDESLARAVRTVLRTYEALVRHYPSSSYCDDALWNAAQLAVEAAARLNDPVYTNVAARYLKRLTSEYPSSKHVRPATTQLAGLRLAPDLPDRLPAPSTREASTIAPPAGSPVPSPVAPAARSGSSDATARSAKASPSTPPAMRAADVAPAVTPGPPAESVTIPVATSGATPGLETSTSAVEREQASLEAAPPLSPAAAQATRSLATLTAIRRQILPDVVRITLELDAEVPFHQETLSKPDRIFFDLAGTKATADLRDRTLRFDGDRDVIRQVRVGRQPHDTTRVVVETEGASCGTAPMYSPYRLVVDCVRVSPAAPSVIAAVTRPTPRTPATLARKPPVAPLAPLGARSIVSPMAIPPVLFARTVVAPFARTTPAGQPRYPEFEFEHALLVEPVPAIPIERAASTLVATATPPPPAPPVPAKPATAAPTPAKSGGAPATASGPAAHNLNGGLSVARQLGLTVSRIVIDPGHGGHDPGARGRGVAEAELVLDIALRLEALLRTHPGVEVILTRRTDEFVPLEERTAIANRESADLFLSIHANASPAPEAGGVETYFLNFANTPAAAAVAARENAASGKPMSALPDVVKTIALNTKVDESRDLATHVQRALVRKLKGSHKALRDLGVKQAPFVVLVGASMPSILTEVSFVTNDREARLLKEDAYRQRIAEALSAAVLKYQTSLTRDPVVSTH